MYELQTILETSFYDQIIVRLETLDGCFSNTLSRVPLGEFKLEEVITKEISLNKYRFYQYVDFLLQEVEGGKLNLILHYKEYL